MESRPLFICFSGIDGTGKTTLSKGVIKALKKKGIDDETLAQTVDDGLKAKRLRTFKGQVLGDEPDNFIRHRFLETILKVRGDFAPDQLNIKVGKEQAENTFQERIKRMNELKNGQKVEEDNPQKEVKNEDL